MKWNEVPLKDLCLKIGSGATPKGGNTVYISKGVSLIRSQNVYNLSFDYSGLVYINDEASEKLRNVTVEKDDVLINITGDSVARTCIVPNQVLPARVNQHVAILRANSKILNPHYLNYYLASPYMQSYMLNLAVGKGASRNAMTKVMLENFTIPLPQLPIQQRIALILSRYDDLIENYQQQIKLLEEAAQRLYKEWFVDLHFPGYENTKIVDGVPEGWEKEAVSSILRLLSGYAFKSSTFESDGKYKIVTIKNVQDNNFETNNTNTILEIPSAMPLHCILKTGDILLSLTGNVGRSCVVVGDNFLLNQRVAKVQTNYPMYVHCLFHNREFYLEMCNLANGAAQLNLSPIKTEGIKVLIPSKQIICEFEQLIDPLFNKKICLYKSITLLTEARDRLLPKLMNGEIEV